MVPVSGNTYIICVRWRSKGWKCLKERWPKKEGEREKRERQREKRKRSHFNAPDEWSMADDHPAGMLSSIGVCATWGESYAWVDEKEHGRPCRIRT